MSKYIDLIGQITERLDVPCGNIRLGIHEALAYLDRYPDQAPGRTITESDYSDIAEWARNYSNRGWEGRTVLAGVGITIVPDPVPDPKPTNAEQLDRIYQAWRQDTDGMGLSVGEWMENHGVTAPGASDE